MTTRVTFLVDGGEESFTFKDVPVPCAGARVELDGRRFFVVGPPVIAYWVAPPQNSVATVHLSRVADEPG